MLLGAVWLDDGIDGINDFKRIADGDVQLFSKVCADIDLALFRLFADIFDYRVELEIAVSEEPYIALFCAVYSFYIFLIFYIFCIF